MTVLSTAELYSIFLESEFWRELSRRKKIIKCRCERCGSTDRLESHHTFYRDHWFDTELVDLEVLCHWCHEKQHRKEKNVAVQAPKVATKPSRQSQSDPKRPSAPTPYDMPRWRPKWGKGRKKRRKKHGKGWKARLLTKQQKQSALQRLNSRCGRPFSTFRCKPVKNWVSRGGTSN